MATDSLPGTLSETTAHTTETNADPQLTSIRPRRSFLKGLGVVGAALSAGSLLATAEEQGHRGIITVGDVSILRFLAAAEILETDLWQQYNELAGIQDDEVPGGTGNEAYTEAVAALDEDMNQYIHDNTEDELSHEKFINAYLVAKGAEPVSLDRFRTLPSSRATGAQQIGRLTNLMQLTVDTTWFTRYRSRTQNPDFGDILPQAIPTLAVGQHTAIPRTDDDLHNSDFLQAIANTAGFHFGTIEQGGTSLYAQLAQRVTSLEVLRILLSIGGTEIMHFQTWSDKAGNAPPVPDVVDPVTGVHVTFPDLNAPPLGGEDYQTNLIMPEPTVFLSKRLPVCSIIRPTKTHGAAMAALKALTADGLFIGQSRAFFNFMRTLAIEADLAVREC
ncbi:MAG: ferritin-like domain-containing protein [Acidobacteriia bacterium]|nr:ferritin-like domain-containing protein [Terriglobia bacterium]